MTDSTPSSPAGRTRTNPTLKWLLNERAALRGDAAKLHNQASHHRRQAATYRQLMEQAESAAKERLEARDSVRLKIAALTTTIEMQFPGVGPYAGGTVSAWKDKYGERGSLTQFIKTALEAHPAGLSCGELVVRVQAHFQLKPGSARERRQLRDVVRSRLRHSNQFELIPMDAPGQPLLWRLTGRLPTISELAFQQRCCDGPIQDPAH